MRGICKDLLDVLRIEPTLKRHLNLIFAVSGQFCKHPSLERHVRPPMQQFAIVLKIDPPDTSQTLLSIFLYNVSMLMTVL